jgi:hypothetical protein
VFLAPLVASRAGVVLVVGYGALTALVAQNCELRVQGIDEVDLNRRAGRVSLIQRAGMPVAPARHLLHQRLVPLVEGRELAPPTTRFRVMSVSVAILRENAPEPMKLAMFPEQVLPA